MKIFIDAGHGGTSIGASYNGRKEQDDTLRLALAVRELLIKQGVEVRMSRETDVDTDIYSFCKAANEWGADYLLSIHRNAAAKPNTASGVEAWVYSKCEKGGTTWEMAADIVDNICSAAKWDNRGVQLGAPAYSDFGCNRYTNMSSCLLEVGFVDSDEDNMIFDDKFRDIALAIAKGLMSAVGLIYIVPGDVDGDGTASSSDARTVLRAAVALEKLTDEQKKAADMDGDGKITSADARLILRGAVDIKE